MNKVILIFSEENDPVTDDVFRWLHKLDNKCLVKRLNYEDDIFGLNIRLPNNEITIKTKDGVLDLNKIHKIWYRRGLINYLNNKEILNYKYYLKHEFNKLHDGIWSILEKKSCSSFRNTHLSKLEMLSKANSLGIMIPKTIYTDSKKELSNFFYENGGAIISKAIENAGFYDEEKKQVFGESTKSVLEKDIINCPNKFFVSAFQETIIKKYEIRTMYYKEHFFSMAIISQNNSKTKVDYRNYDDDNPNRNLPYQLPVLLEKKIIKLMKSLRLETGSLDLILTSKNEYVFLEVNPFGQYLPVDYLFRGEISKLIANDILN